MEPTHNQTQSHDHEWVINISRFLEEDTEDTEELTSMRIFNVPKALLSTKKEAYTPQVIALGPYHHRRLELFEMERHKLATAKKVRNKMRPIKFFDFVTQIVAQNDTHIRSFYHRYLDFDQETLAWMLAIDASFLFLYLKTFPFDRRWQRSMSLGRRSSLKIGHLMEHSRRNTWNHAVLRDIIMLENQIPLFLLKEIHFSCNPEDNKYEALASMLIGFCKDLAPIKHIDEQRFKQECFTRAHLLELLYYTIFAHCELLLPFGDEIDREKEKKNMDDDDEIPIGPLKAIINFMCFLICAPIQVFSKIFKSKLMLQLVTVPWNIIASILRFRGTGVINDIVLSAHDVIEEAESVAAQHKDATEGLLVEEIAIPSVEELSKIGVKFCPTRGGLNTIKFDMSSAMFHLPVIHLNHNSEVVLRNLVAYEACIAPEGMVFTRYTELMNGIIDTEEDVRILRESGVLVNRLKSDKEVASMWNGMTTSVTVTKVPFLDKAIDNVNAYYDASWKVKVKGGMKKYVYGSWPCLTFLAANLIICLTALETLCSVYSCSKWFGAS
ncbi:putative UPF0481 protein At3g02645 [Abrus precatorius]|uniref:UPF0481 protein At3g02645 n=1 Tax=Abrus precatorius TaxID=3816 RepID=A0A8B8JPC0_ABRPR|nr:putative UPF0481 protein At3g02645 [Abrus precatorius]